MRTTIELPDPIFRQLKSCAALEGRELKELIAEYVEQGMARRTPSPEPAQRSAPRAAATVDIAAESAAALARLRRGDPPVARPPTGESLPVLSGSEVADLIFDRSAGFN